MKQYQELISKILSTGRRRADRTGTGTIGIFGYQTRFNLAEGFPLVTTKKTHLKSIIHELLWFLQGDTNIHYLKENGVSIWDEWAITESDLSNKPSANPIIRKHFDSAEIGDLGPVYGHQWRSWAGAGGQIIDQIAHVITQLKSKPYSRRIIVSAWNVADLPDETMSPQQNVLNGKMALAPCHALFQFYVEDLTDDEIWMQAPEHVRRALMADGVKYMNWPTDLPIDKYPPYNGRAPLEGLILDHGLKTKRLCCQLYQRSCDTFLGLSYNIASYSLLTMMIAQQVDMLPGDFIWTGGDTHLYLNHLEQAHELLQREPRPLPSMTILRKPDSIFDYRYEDFQLDGYDPHPAIKAPISV